MSTEVIMPQLGESVVEGTVTKWLKQVGDPVEEFEPLLEVNTDKVDTEVPSPATGTVLQVYVAEGETVEAGTLLAVLGEAGEEIPEAPESKPKAAPAKAVAAEPEPVAVPASHPAPAPAALQPVAGRSRELGFISPVVARIAGENSIDLSLVPGTGQNGRITKKDILAFIETRKPAAPWEEPASGELFRPTEEIFGAKPTATKARPAAPVIPSARPGTVVPLNSVRTAIAEHMVRSKRTSPHVTTVMEADMSRVVAHRLANKVGYAADGVKLTFSAYFAMATVEALKTVPMANSSFSDDGIVLHPAVNLGMAVSLGEQGLIVPVIKNAEQISLRGMATAIDDLATRARGRKLQPDEVAGGTFTITNHGVSGSLFATPIINQPQCGILGVGIMQKRVVVVETPTPDGKVADSIAIRPMVYLTLTFDHRILDGAVADAFLGTVVDRLENWSE
jgi:2-oxoglutarate dehydrogenase E2 component (dihydrolipoamide succinyltransferase)